MLPITTLRLDPRRSENPWPQIVRVAHEWGAPARIAWRDAIVLVPFAQHLPLARRAWAEIGGWLPRIETTQTLARSIGPGEAPEAGQIAFDAAVDRLTVRRMLHDQGWAADWARQDPRAFEDGASSVVRTAHVLARAAAALPPGERAAHWARGRILLAALGGPGATERALLRIAFEWAAASPVPGTDAIFEQAPAAWVVVQAGGPDPFVTALLATVPSDIPQLLVSTDADLHDPFAGACAERIAVATCSGFEDEAQTCAAQVIAALGAGTGPVALVSQDRLLTRRVRALLARQNVPLQDETGWKLSTTRAAGVVKSLLRAAHRDASSDDWLDWLKSCSADWPGLPGADVAGLALERDLRKRRWAHPASVRRSELGASSSALWSAATSLLDRLGAPRVRSLGSWLQVLENVLTGCGALPSLQLDDAGRQVLAALHLDIGAGFSINAPIGRVMDESMTLEEFGAWVDAVLEDGTFLPTPASGRTVVVTPLERAMLRPFGTVVLPGADEKRLGAAPPPLPLLSDTLAAELGAPTLQQRRDAEVLAFAQLVRAPRLVILRRVDDAGERLGPSALLERLALSLQRRGRFLDRAPECRVTRECTAAPVARPLPSAADLLPDRLSATAFNALRTCPYQFFTLRLLRLREAEELDDEFEKRDYGTWLHAVLHRFHAERRQPLRAEEEVVRLRQVAMSTREALGLDEAAFLPFAATFARFAPRYIEWLHGRDATGARWIEGEVEMTARPPEWNGLEMHGIIDRIDRLPDGLGGETIQLIDYKTGSAKKLRDQLATPLEDTQLALYAALLAANDGGAHEVSAMYLPLDESGAVKPVEHPRVAASAQRLVAGIGGELARIRAGAALPALGEGPACDFCSARGLCRRDHWVTREHG